MNNKLKGTLLILNAAFFFAVMNFLIKFAGNLPFFEKVIFRNMVALIVAYIIIKRSRVQFFPSKRNLSLMLTRVGFGTIGLFSNFYALDHLLIGDASMLSKISPFSAMLFSFIFLREKVSPKQLLFTIGAFIGCAFVMKPSGDSSIFPALIGLLGGMSAGIAYTCVRGLGGRGVAGPTIVFDFALFSTLIALPLFILHYVNMSWVQLLILLSAGVCATIAQFSLTLGYKCAPSREISIFDYTNVLFTAFLGFLFLSEIPDGWSLVGYAITFTMALFMFIYNKREYTKELQQLQQQN